MKTWNAKPAEVQRRWYVVDAEGETLGRLATRVADTLRGKGKPEYTPHVDTGDFVVVVNAEKVAVTGKKLEQKLYYRHSGYPGGLRSRTLAVELERRPTEVLRKAMFTGSKVTQKVYRRHTLYPGGLRETTVTEMFAKHPERVIELAVKGMLPRNRLGRAQIRKLKIYAGPEHPHEAQQPQPLPGTSRRTERE